MSADEEHLQRLWAAGAKAWADVPNATRWVEELRGHYDLPNIAPGTRPPLDALDALLRRGYEWEPCDCKLGVVQRLHGEIRCRQCHGDGGRFRFVSADEHENRLTAAGTSPQSCSPPRPAM